MAGQVPLIADAALLLTESDEDLHISPRDREKFQAYGFNYIISFDRSVIRSRLEVS